jgi:hypothetical protein
MLYMFCYTSQIYGLIKNVAIDVTYIEKMLQFRFFVAIIKCISHMTHMLTCIAVVFILIFDHQFSLVVFRFLYLYVVLCYECQKLLTLLHRAWFFLPSWAPVRRPPWGRCMGFHVTSQSTMIHGWKPSEWNQSGPLIEGALKADSSLYFHTHLHMPDKWTVHVAECNMDPTWWSSSTKLVHKPLRAC